MTGFTPKLPMTRRRLLMAGGCAAGGLALYSGEVERHWIEITHHEIFLEGLAKEFDGFRVAQLSDIHMDAYTEPFLLRRAVRHINELHPDAVFLTGDYVSWLGAMRRLSVRAAWQCAALLDGLECRQRYAVLGNHDIMVNGARVTEALEAHGITVLNNANLPIERGGRRFWLAGVRDPSSGVSQAEVAISETIRNQPKEPVILLCHAPDYADQLLVGPVGGAVSLMICGHTHGGQVRLPFVGPVILPSMGKKYVQGWFRLGQMQLYVNRGLGTVGVPFRLNCPPEISLFTLRMA